MNRRWWSAIDDPARGARLRDIIICSLLSALAVALILAFTELKTEGTALYNDPGWDRHLYRLMAEQGLFEFRLAPYCWRVLVPALAGWSPFSLQASFFSITVTLLALVPRRSATLLVEARPPSPRDTTTSA